MQFEFDLASDDYAAFNMHALSHRPAGVKQLKSYRISVSVLVATASFAIIGLVLGDPVGGLVTGVITGVVMWFLTPWAWRRQVRSNVRNMSRENGLGTPGRHLIELDETGIREQSPNRTTITTWDKLQQVDETSSHIFIFTGPVEAYMIPRTAGPDEIAGVLTAIRTHRPDLMSMST